ncbi:MAG TPA: ABC transporter permease, partial [Blastocatellia bacterium]|nr:ABC transporter permease [Blastocatellia bacterium]
VEGNRSFDSIAVMKSWQPTISGADQPERIDGQRVSASYFRVLGILPALGRVFDRSEDQSNGANVVILSDSLWHRRFGHDPSIIGKQIDLDDDSSELTAGGNTYTVIGVMPEDFVNVLAPSVELWAPLQYGMNQGRTWGHHLRMVGRLLPGVSPAQANSDLDRIGNTLIQEHPNDVFNSRFVVNSLQEDVTRQVKPALLAVFGAVILVLLIACVNVTNLLLARGAQRRGEFAMRAALGASRTRLIRQLLTECFQLSIGGGAIGMAVAAFGSQAIVALSPSQLPRFGSIGVDATIFAFGLGATALMGVCFGLIPALNASRTDLRSGIQQGSQRTAGGYQSTRNALVVAEVALALILLVSSGLLLRSLQRLFAVNPGFDSSHLLTMQVQEVGSRFQSDGARNRFYADALDAVRRTPGVQAAAFSSQLPLSSDDDEYGVVFQSDNDPDNHYPVFRYAVSPGYFETMNIPLRQGRFLDERDAGDGPVAVLINESLAKSKFKGQDPIGQHLHFGPDSDRWDTIVGVVGDVSQKSLAAGQPDAVYIPSSRWPGVDTVQSLVVRANGNVDALAADVKNAVWSVDRGQPIVRVETIDEVVAAAFAERRFALLLFEGFGIMALLLAAIGLYGVLSGSVAERTREIGIRSALGASRGGILALVVRQGMGLTCL